MNKKIISISVLTLMLIPILNTTANTNQAIPNAPIITGETNGIIGTKYNYTIKTFDPDNDFVYYQIRWGDCMVINNAGPYASGEEVVFSHAFCSLCCGPGDFTIQVKAKDKDGVESGWGTLDVKMNSNKDDSFSSDSHDSHHHSNINFDREFHTFHDFIQKLIKIFPILNFLLPIINCCDGL